MGFLDSIEKLINEHGSASILKERIALGNDKYALLEDKVALLEDKITHLEPENQRLRIDLEKAEAKIKNFENKGMTQMRINRS
jgi:hypothetical protein